MPKKVLVITSQCYDPILANGICAREIYQKFQELGYDTYLLGIGNPLDEEKKGKEFSFSFVKNQDQTNGIIQKYMQCFKRIVTVDYDPTLVGFYYRKIKELDKIYHFDLMIAVYFPLEVVCAVSKYKKKRKDFQYVIYELDSKTDGIHGKKKGLIGKLVRASTIRWQKKQYRTADMVCSMLAHRTDIEALYPHFLNKKIHFVDLPLLQDHTSKEAGTTDGVQFAYTGELNSFYRSPDKFLHILQKTKAHTDWQIHFYSKGDCEDRLQAFSMEDNRVFCHGYVSQELLKQQYRKLSFFVNIGNACSNSVPSKMIQYISTGKPIIHLCLQKEDICAEYLRKYPFALIIEWEDSVEEAARKMEDFVKETMGKKVPFSIIKERYVENTPQYSVEKIATLLE